MSHFVYRCYSTDRELLYVGASKDIEARIRGHRDQSFWAGLISGVLCEEFPTKAEATAVERKAIREESPRFNIIGRWPTRHGWTKRQAGDYLAACRHRTPTLANRAHCDRAQSFCEEIA